MKCQLLGLATTLSNSITEDLKGRFQLVSKFTVNIKWLWIAKNAKLTVLDYQEVCEWAEWWHMSFMKSKYNIVDLVENLKI